MHNASRFSTDPLVRARRSSIALWLLGLSGVAAVASWAWTDPEPDGRLIEVAASSAESPPPSDPEPACSPAFAADAFDLDLWNEKPPPAPSRTSVASAVQRRVPVPLLRVQLVGVLQEQAGGLRAAVYDPATDRLRVLERGDSLGSYRLTEVRLDGVSFSSGGRSQQILLQEAGR